MELLQKTCYTFPENEIIWIPVGCVHFVHIINENHQNVIAFNDLKVRCYPGIDAYFLLPPSGQSKKYKKKKARLN